MPQYNFSRRTLISTGLALSVASLTTPAFAQGAYPQKPLKFVIPFSAGGDTDVIGRTIANKLNQMYGYTVVVENKAGAGSSLGTEAALREPADGYTFLVITGSFVSNAVVKKPTAMQEVQPIIAFSRTPTVIVTSGSSDVKTLQQFINKAKSRPGMMTFGTAGIGSQGHFSGEYFAARAGIKLSHVPYKGVGNSVNDVIGGQVDMLMAGVMAMETLAKAGQVRILAVINEKRLTQFPDVPTVDEAGLKDYEGRLWHGLVAAKGVPTPIIAKLNKEINAALQAPDVLRRFELQGVTPLGGTPEQLTQMMHEDYDRLQSLVKQMDIKFQ